MITNGKEKLNKKIFLLSEKVDGGYWKHTCNRCNKIWYSKMKSPICCVKCRSPYWNKKRIN